MDECEETSHCEGWPCMVRPSCEPRLVVRGRCWQATCTLSRTSPALYAAAGSSLTALAIVIAYAAISKCRVCRRSGYDEMPGGSHDINDPYQEEMANLIVD